MIQQDLFGGGVDIPVKTAGPYVPAAYSYATCWEDCAHCGSLLSAQAHKDTKKRVFALCQHPRKPGHKVFEADAICERVSRISKPQPVKPSTEGWDDY
jgi:hypothetical protein